MHAPLRTPTTLDEPARVLRAATARGGCCRVVVRAKSDEFMYREVCRTLTDAGYRSCAVHREDEPSVGFREVAHMGPVHSKTINPPQRTDDDSWPQLTPANATHVQAVERESQGSSPAPVELRILGRPAGARRFVLSLTAFEIGAFTGEELVHLRELVRDIVAGVEGLKKRSESAPGADRKMLGQPAPKIAPAKVDLAVRDQLDMTRSIADCAQDGIVMVDDCGKINYWNRAAAKIFGWSFDEAMGMTLHDMLAPDRFHEAIEAFFPIFAETEKGAAVGQVTELVGVNKDGSKFPLELSLARTRFRDRWAAVGIVRDITARKKVLEDLKKAKGDAEAAAEAKSLFLANMSHEIRTPLNAVIGMTGLLLDTELDNRQRDFVRIVHRSGESLLSVINDILDFSKMDAGALEFEVIPFSVRTCVEEVGDILAQKAAGKGLELVILIDHLVPRRVAGDPGRLRQVLTNLINNAIKFTESGEVVLRAGLKASDGHEHRLDFSIADTGIGIPQDRLDELFSPFTQVDSSTTRRFGGTGLGLSIAKRLVDRMGGKIEVTSEVDKGTVFRFDVVFLSAPDEERVSPVRHGTLQGKSALIVDDNLTNRRLLEELLGRWGCSSESAASGPVALDLLADPDRKSTFDFAILDFSMPSMNGATLAKSIRSDTPFALMPLILLTSMPEFGDGEKMKEAGFNAYLTKPVKQSYLYDAIMSVTTGRDDPAWGDEGLLVTKHTLNEARRSRMRILVTEDNIINQKVLSRMLESLGYRCDLADHGRAALEALERQPYDVVFMDCQMPVMDGFEATRKIRLLDGPVSEIPIVATTAEALKGDRERCIEAGMNDYISKPIDRGELAATLERITGPSDGDSHEPGPAAPDEPGAISEPVEIERLQAISRGDTDFEERILDLYLQESVKRSAAIAAALEDDDFETVREDAHATKGSAGNIGASKVSELAGRLQAAAEDCDRAACVEISDALAKANEAANRWIETYVDGLGATSDGVDHD